MNLQNAIVAVLGGGLLLSSASLSALDVDFVPVGRYAKAPGGPVEKILVAGKHAFIAQLPEIDQNTGAVGQGGGLHVVSIDDPSSPRAVAHYATRVILDFALAGTNLILLEEPHYLPDGTSTGGGLHVIDISDPANLRRTGLYPWPSTGSLSRPLAVTGEIVYIMELEQNGVRLSVIDISDRSNPRRVGSYRPDWKTWPTSLLPADDYLYVAAETEVNVLDVGDPSAPRNVKVYPVGTSIMAASAADGILFLAERSFQNPNYISSLSIADVTVPANPTRIGHLPGGVNQPVALAIQQEHLYLLELDDHEGNTRDLRMGTLRVIDVSIPSEPKQVGVYETSGIYEMNTGFPVSAIPLLVENDLALVGDSGGFTMVDISNPALPTLVSRHAVRSDARDVALMGDYAVIADGFAGLEVFDVADPSAPKLAGNYLMSAPANSVTVNGTLAYVAALGELHLVDLSDVSRPKRIGILPVPGDPQKVVVIGNYTFVPALPGPVVNGGLHILDTTDPATPRVLGSYGTAAIDVTVASNYAYVGVPSNKTDPPPKGSLHVLEELHVVDITNPSAPERVLAISAPVRNLIRSGNHVYIAGTAAIIPFGFGGAAPHQTGLSVLNISNRALPVLLGSYSHRGDRHARGIAISGTVAFTTEHLWTCPNGCFFFGASVRAFDVSDPMNPHPIGAYRLPDYPKELPVRSDLGVASSGEFVFVAGGGSGLHVLKTAPSNPQRASTYRSSLPLSSVVVSGDHAYVAGSFWDFSGQTNRLEVIDISAAGTPQTVATYDAERVIVSVAPSTQGTILLEAGSVLTNGFEWPLTYLEVLDMSNPSSPVVKGTYSTPFVALDLTALGPFAYLLARDSGPGSGVLEIVNLTGPTAPEGVGRLDLESTPAAIAVAGRYAYLVVDDSSQGRLEIIDVSIASNPETVGRLFTPGFLVDVTVSGGYAYLAEQPRWDNQSFIGGGLLIVEIRNPAAPKVIGRCLDGVYGRGVAVLGDYAYLLEGDFNDDSVHVIDARDPENPRRVGGKNIDGGYLGTIAVGHDKIYVPRGERGLLRLHAYRPIRFETVSSGANGMLNMRIVGPPNVPAYLQSSADFDDWQDVMSLTFTESALDISTESNELVRFFRVTTEP